MTTNAAPPLGSRVLIAIVVTLLAWASAFIVIRVAADDFSGGALALGRLLVGTAALSLFLIGRRWVRPTGREWLLIVVFGLAWFGVYNVALNIAEHTLDAGTTAMIVNIGPLLIALGAGLFLGEGIPRWLAIGAGVAFAGVVLIGIGMGASGLGDGVGVAWALLAALTYAIGVLCQKPVLQRLPASQVTWMGCAVGAIACLPFAGELVAQTAMAPPLAVASVVYLGLVPTAVAFSTWAYALGRMPAGQARCHHVHRADARRAARPHPARRGADAARDRRWRALPRRGRAEPAVDTRRPPGHACDRAARTQRTRISGRIER
jgi:drug/metabolite transporter (DMT)-like permease